MIEALRKNISILNTPIVRHILFWLAVYGSYFITANWTFYQNVTQVAEMYFMMTSLQIIVAYSSLNLLIPKLLNQKKYVAFIISELILLVCIVACYHYGKTLYFYPEYPNLFAEQIRTFGYLPLWERVANIPVTLSKSVFYFSPTLVLLLFRYFKNQQELLQLNEQKKTAELTALKHQLNPHFLFNTLNNLYALAIKKSDQTPEVIEKLSYILDYMLYRCNEKFVALAQEIELIENYLALEKVRYGSRVKISFNKKIDYPVKIAPLLLLTFLENAFKHGVSQELKEACIAIQLIAEADFIRFEIKNSKAKNAVIQEKETSIGLKNIHQQLDLLYASDYDLQIIDGTNEYQVLLKLPSK